VPGVPFLVLLSSVAGKPVLSHRNLPVGKKEWRPSWWPMPMMPTRKT
jgi:hypothetical protein